MRLTLPLRRGVLLLLLAVLLSACASIGPSPTAADGTLDLRSWSFARDGLARLDGEWEFYWGQLLTPSDFVDHPPAPTGLYPFPSSWNTLTVDGQRLPKDGYLTLRLRVIAPPGAPSEAPYGLYIPSFNGAYVVWVNGARLATSGRVASAADESQSEGFSQLVRFTDNALTLTVIVQVSSFEEVPGGPIGRFALGPATAVATWDYRQIAVDLFVGSACLVIGLYYLSLYLLRRRETAFLWFGLFCALIALRSTLVGREVIHLMWPALTWRASLQLIFFLGQIVAPLFAAFSAALYPREAWRRVTWAALALGLGSAVAALAAPPSAFFDLSMAFNGITVLIALYALTIGVRAAWRRRPGARLLLFSNLPLVAATIVEALGFLRVIPLYSVAGFGVLGTIAGQTLTLSRNFVLAFAAVEALSERLERTNKAYYRFVPREFLRLVGKDDIVSVQLGDQAQRAMTVLFSDVRNFTSLSETMSPEENFAFINMLLSSISPLIRQQRGFIDKYMGDGIMALFPEQPGDALKAAVDMQRALRQFNVEREARGQPRIRIGIGLHFGQLMLGTVGEPERMDGSVIADAVNTASRLESLTKRYGAAVLVSEPTLQAIANRDALGLRMLGKVRAKGKQEAVSLYELYEGDPPEQVQLKRTTRAEFEDGLRHFQSGQFAEAQARFERVLQANPQDAAAAYYRARSAQFASEGTPPDWDGIEALTEK